MDRSEVRTRRKAAKLSLRELAELSEVSKPTIIKIESGEGRVLPRLVARVGRALAAFEAGKGVAR